MITSIDSLVLRNWLRQFDYKVKKILFTWSIILYLFLSVSYRIEQCKYFNWDYSLLLYWVNPCWQSWHHLQTGSLSSHHNITHCPLIVSHQYTWLSLSWEEALSHVGSLHQHHDNNYGDKTQNIVSNPFHPARDRSDQLLTWVKTRDATASKNSKSMRQ